MAVSPAREQLAVAHFIKLGYSPVQAAGIVGNLIQESSLNTAARNPGDGQDGSDSIGVGQWNGGRARALRNFAAARGRPVDDLTTQLDFVDHELRGVEGAAGSRLRAAQDVRAATAAMIGYERPRGWSAATPQAGDGWHNRYSHAARLAGIDPKTLPAAPDADELQWDTHGAYRGSSRLTESEIPHGSPAKLAQIEGNATRAFGLSPAEAMNVAMDAAPAGMPDIAGRGMPNDQADTADARTGRMPGGGQAGFWANLGSAVPSAAGAFKNLFPTDTAGARRVQSETAVAPELARMGRERNANLERSILAQILGG